MRLTRSLLAFFVVLASVSLSATQISIGQLGLLSGTPFAGNQTLSVFNSTGMCDGISFFVCDNLNISNWKLVVELSSGTQTFTAAGSGDDIGPGAFYTGQSMLPWEFDQSCMSGSCPPFDTTITHVTFSGSIGSSGPVLVNIGSPGSTTTFFADNNFSVDYTPTLLVDPPTGTVYSDPVELLVNSYSGPSGNVPEPSGLVLSILGVGALATKLSRRAR